MWDLRGRGGMDLEGGEVGGFLDGGVGGLGVGVFFNVLFFLGGGGGWEVGIRG